MAEIYLDIVQRAQRFIEANKQARAEVGKTEQKVKESNQKMQDNFNRSANVVSSLRNKLIGLFTIAAAAQFVRQIIAVRSEFEKYAAVLKNTLGSQLAAARAMDMIRDFAAKTPFSVRELTDAFVRLANQGFKPSEEEMRKLGDVAASTGKSFNQLAEAIIDATVGEFERLKEFGIRASKEGDKVRFTFKGVETQVDFTAQAIREYILSLGDAEGVSGAMAEISKTLGGQISNLGDSWDTLLDLLGGRTQGAFSFAIKNLQRLSDGVANFLKMDPQYRAGSRLNTFVSEIENLDKVAKQTAIDDFIKELTKDLDDYNNMGLVQRFNNKKNIETTENLIVLLKHYNDEIVNGTFNTKTSTDATEKNTKALEDYRAEMLKLIIQLRLLERAMAMEDAQKLWDEARRELEAYFDEQKKLADKQADEWQTGQDIIKQMVAETYDSAAESADEWFKGFMEKKEKELAKEKELDDFKRDALQSITELSSQYADLQLAKNQSAMDQELAALEEKHKKQLISDEQYEKQRDTIQKKYARENQKIAVNQALINGALAITKTFAEYGFTPIALGLAALMGIQTSIQVATIKAQKFSKGVLDLKGPGSETSDSIPAMLSRRESVMTAQETKDFYPYLKAMKEGTFPRFDLEIARKFEKNTYNNLNYDNSKEIKELRTIAGLLKTRNAEVEFIQGGQRVIKKGNVTTRINLN